MLLSTIFTRSLPQRGCQWSKMFACRAQHDSNLNDKFTGHFCRSTSDAKDIAETFEISAENGTEDLSGLLADSFSPACNHRDRSPMIDYLILTNQEKDELENEHRVSRIDPSMSCKDMHCVTTCSRTSFRSSIKGVETSGSYSPCPTGVSSVDSFILPPQSSDFSHTIDAYTTD